MGDLETSSVAVSVLYSAIAASCTAQVGGDHRRARSMTAALGRALQNDADMVGAAALIDECDCLEIGVDVDEPAITITVRVDTHGGACTSIETHDLPNGPHWVATVPRTLASTLARDERDASQGQIKKPEEGR